MATIRHNARHSAATGRAASRQRARLIPVLLASLSLVVTGLGSGAGAWASDEDPVPSETAASTAAASDQLEVAPLAAEAPVGDVLVNEEVADRAIEADDAPATGDEAQSTAPETDESTGPEPSGDVECDEADGTAGEDREAAADPEPIATPTPEPIATPTPEPIATPTPAPVELQRSGLIRAGTCSYKPVSATGTKVDAIDDMELKTWNAGKKAWEPTTSLQYGSGFRLEGSWSIPNDSKPKPGDQFTLEFPKNAAGKSVIVTQVTQLQQPLKDAAGLTVAMCDIGPDAYTCTFTDYPTCHDDLKGTFDLSLRAQDNTGGEDMTWTTGSKTWVTIGVKPGKGPGKNYIPANFGKGGYTQGNDWKNWHWRVDLTDDTAKGADRSMMQKLKDMQARGDYLVNITDTMGDVSFFDEPQGVVFTKQAWEYDTDGKSKLAVGPVTKWELKDGAFPADSPLQVVQDYDTSQIDADGSLTGLEGAQLGIYKLQLNLEGLDLESSFYRFEFNSKMSKSVKDISGVGMVNLFTMEGVGNFQKQFNAPKNSQTAGGVSGSISWVKVDASDTKVLLPGSVWEISGTTDAGDPVTPFKVVDNVNGTTTMKDQNPAAGRFRVSGLASGTYKVREVTAPAGYAVDPTVHEVAVPEVVGNTKKYDQSLGLLKNSKGAKIQFRKMDGSTALAGATFVVTGKNSAGADIWKSPQTLTTDAEGRTNELEVELGATYTIKETAAPTGYQVPANASNTFTVDQVAPDVKISWGTGEVLPITTDASNPAVGIVSNAKTWTPAKGQILVNKRMVGTPVPETDPARVYTFTFDAKVVASPSGKPDADVRQNPNPVGATDRWKVSSNGQIVAAEGTPWPLTVTVTGDGTKPGPDQDGASAGVLTNIQFSAKGHYEIEVTERQEGGKPGITGDSTSAIYAFDVDYDASGNLVSTPVKPVKEQGHPDNKPVTGSAGRTVEFANEYEPKKVSFRPTLSKALDVRNTPKEGVSRDFTFIMKKDEEKSTPVVTPEIYKPALTDPIVVTGVSGTTDKVLLKMPSITFGQKGTYVYTVTEKPETPRPAGWTFEEEPVTITVVVDDVEIGPDAVLYVQQVTYEHKGKTYSESWTSDGAHTPDTSGGTAEEAQKVVNVYEPDPTKVPFTAQKVIDHPGTESLPEAFKDLAFDVELSAANDAARTVLTAPTAKTVGAADAWNAASQVSFDELEFTKAGEYKFRITEKVPDPVPTGWSYDSTPANVTVTVKDVAGQLTPTVVYDKGDQAGPAEFTNTYVPTPTSFAPQVVKGLEVPNTNEAPIDDFDFHLEPKGATAQATGQRIVSDADANAHVQDVAPDKPQTGDFGAIEFTAPGTYEYTITENIPGAGPDDDPDYPSTPQPGWKFDTTAITLKVVVAEDPDAPGTLKVVEASYDGGQGAARNQVVNRYVPDPAKAAPKVLKQVDVPVGVAPAATVEFDLEQDPAAGEGAGVANAHAATMPQSTIATATTSAGNAGEQAAAGPAEASFGEVTFPHEGTYTFTISEKVPDPVPTGWTYDAAKVTWTVVVVDGGEGKLVVESETYAGGQGDVANGLVNKYQPTPGEFTPQVTKVVEAAEGVDAPDREFSFTIKQNEASGEGAEAVNPVAVYPEGVEGTTATVSGLKAGDSKVADFATFTLEQPGTYTFAITEDVPDPVPTGWTFDAEPVELTVVVEDRDGVLTATSATYTGGRDGKGQAVNKYQPTPGEFTPQVTKVVEAAEGIDAPDREFSFTIKQNEASGEGAEAVNPVAVYPEGVEGTTATVSGLKAGDSKVADFATFTLEQPGTYTFAITEDVPDPVPTGWTFEAKPVELTVVVEDRDGVLTATSATYTGGRDGKGQAVNAYAPPPPPEEPPPPGNPPEEPRKPHDPPKVTSRIPKTGAEIAATAGAALGLLAAGAFLIAGSRRRGDGRYTPQH